MLYETACLATKLVCAWYPGCSHRLCSRGPKVLSGIFGRTGLLGNSISGEITNHSHLYNIRIRYVPFSEVRHVTTVWHVRGKKTKLLTLPQCHHYIKVKAPFKNPDSISEQVSTNIIEQQVFNRRKKNVLDVADMWIFPVLSFYYIFTVLAILNIPSLLWALRNLLSSFKYLDIL